MRAWLFVARNKGIGYCPVPKSSINEGIKWGKRQLYPSLSIYDVLLLCLCQLNGGADEVKHNGLSSLERFASVSRRAVAGKHCCWLYCQVM